MNGQIKIGDRVKNQYGDIYQRVEGKVGRSYATFVRVTNGKLGKRKTAIHSSFKLELI
jgi:hypothetical protein